MSGIPKKGSQRTGKYNHDEEKNIINWEQIRTEADVRINRQRY